jgi:hypothetical protein
MAITYTPKLSAVATPAAAVMVWADPLGGGSRSGCKLALVRRWMR